MNDGTIVYDPKSPADALDMCKILTDIIVGCLRYLERSTDGTSQCADLIQDTNAIRVKLALLDIYLNPKKIIDKTTEQ